ncbi:MAG: response regulator transcription factor [Actinomycetota bacterium]|nr:response regulator transcription factor [Actinomycetota bacterium]
MTDASDRPTVLIVDDHELFSCALVIALGTRGLRARQLTPGELLARLDQPAPPGGLVLLDLDLGDNVDGAQLVGPLRRAGWRILVITGTTDEPHIAAAVAAGAVGWVPKTAPFNELLAHAVRTAEGRSLLTDAQRQRMQEIASGARQAAEELEWRWQLLTPREREILDCLVGGLRAGTIAEKFTVSVATVRTQIRSILAKLEVSSQLEAVALAKQRSRSSAAVRA